MTAHLRARHFVVALIGALVALMTGVAASSAGPPAGSATSTTFTATPLAATGSVTANKAPTSGLAKTDPALLGRTDRTPVQVLIKLDYDSIATYQGDMAGLPATSPTVTGTQLTGGTKAERTYGAYVARTERAIVADLQQSVPRAEIGASLRTVYGGITAEIPANTVKAVLGVDGVVAVQKDALRQPLTDSSPAFVGAPGAYDALGTTANAGEGVIYGNLDTGIWPEHQSFADLGNLSAPPGPARECNYGDNPLTPAADPFVCQDKLIGGDHKTNTYDAQAAAGNAVPDLYAGTARDGDGHGTHTSSTSAGNIVEDVEALDRDLPAIHGLAPGAWVMEYKVCGPDGCFNSDSVSAVQQAILDGVDVINFSISGGEQPFNDPVELAFLDAYAAGLFVSASAGNSGPGAGTANHLSPWTTTVGASTQTREFATTLSLTATGGDTFTVDGASITAGAGPLPVVLAESLPGYPADCGIAAPPGAFAGRIVACRRGGQARVWKGFAVLQGGAEGMVLYNPTLADTETDNHWLPTVHVADGTDFVAFMTTHAGVTGSFPQGEPRDGQGDVMAAFSSRGPGGLFVKPDLTAPGVQILAGASPTPPAPDPVAGGSPRGNFYQAIAGTSMSSPHVAGAGILVRAVHPEWTPGQVRSALMTTAVTDVVKEDLTTPADPFDMGGGRIDIGDAILAPLTFDEEADDFFALGNDPVNAVHLNLPSINAPVMPGRVTTVRVATNTSGLKEKLEVTTEAPAGSSITVTPKKFNLQPGASQSLTVVIESDAPVGDQQFGEIELSSDRGHALHLPVAWIHTQGSVTLTQSCSPTTIPVNGQTECDVQATNNSFDTHVVDLDTLTPPGTTMVGVDGGAVLVGPRHAQKHNVTLNGASPGVPSVDPGSSPAGYLPLDAFGITPIAIGDEEIINFNVPPFRYNGQTWGTVGVDSNGYLIVGGGTAEDNNCCNLPTGADPARPNNILAPFWTDLDGTGAPGIFAATLTDGVNTWLVIEYRVNVFGTTSLRTFQVWIGVDAAQDISFTYSAQQTDPAGQDFLVGAENTLGQGDVSSFLPGPDLVVTSTDFTPGGVTTYGVTIRGDKKGTFAVTTEMDASGVPGTTIVRTPITVQKP